MSVLGRVATVRLREDWGITRAQWVAAHGYQGKWGGDRCGCPDDQCIGNHHGISEAECGCRETLARELWRELADTGQLAKIR